MSALARYFIANGKVVAGYDRTATPLTDELQKQGAKIHFEDNTALIGEDFMDSTKTLVVYTPAIPKDHKEYNWFLSKGFEVVKRSDILGHISEGKYVMAVAGTHGKTSTTTMTAWFNHIAGGGGSAFLGGISKNFNSNLVIGEGDRLAVEADEFDRSFLKLYPDVAVITSADADHLDIYGTHEAVKEAFSQFISQIKKGGTAIIKKGVELTITNTEITIYSYSYDEEADFYAKNVILQPNGHYIFDVVCPDRVIEGCTLGIPGWVNIENAVAAISLLWVAGFDQQRLKEAMESFSGVKRRFDIYINTPDRIYMDDYAHHPKELEATITSIKRMFPGRRLTAVFQPHLYTRTRDFYKEFATALSNADEVILLPIYPAREEPIEGVTSEIIAQRVTVPCIITPKECLVSKLSSLPLDIVVTFGAGDIDNYCEQIADTLK